MDNQIILQDVRHALNEMPQNWLALGDAISMLEANGPRDDNGTPWRDVLAQIFHEETSSTITRGHINKVLRVRNFIRDLQLTSGDTITDHELLRTSQTSLEIASRIYEIDPNKSRRMVLDAINGKSVSKIKIDYDDFISANTNKVPEKTLTWQKKRKTLSYTETVSILEYILTNNPGIFASNGLSEIIHISQPLDKMRFFHDKGRFYPTDEIFLSKHNGELSLIGMHLIDGPSTAPGRLSAEAADYRSSLFDQYWLVINQAPKISDELLYKFESLGIEGVGVIEVKEQKIVNFLKIITPNASKADRRHLMWEYIINGLEYNL